MIEVLLGRRVRAPSPAFVSRHPLLPPGYVRGHRIETRESAGHAFEIPGIQSWHDIKVIREDCGAVHCQHQRSGQNELNVVPF